MDAVPDRLTDPDAYDDYLFMLTELLTDVPAAFEVGVVDGVLVAACGWYDDAHGLYCTRVTCWHWVN
jgi:hypothetical protein